MTGGHDSRAVRARIAALLTLADPARGGTPAECDVAADKARRLAERHQVDLDEVRRDHDQILAGHAPGEQVLRVDGPHAVRALLLVWQIARILHVTTTPMPGGERLSGREVDVQQLLVVHQAAWPALLRAHEQLLRDLRRPGARAARRYLASRWPDPRYERDVVAQLRYSLPGRLADEVHTEIGGTPAAARTAARALIAGRPSPIDAAPDDVEIAWWDGALDTIARRVRDLDRVRNPNRPPAPAPTDVEDVLTDEEPPAAVPVPAVQRRRRRAVDPGAREDLERHARAAGADAPLGIVDLEAPP